MGVFAANAAMVIHHQINLGNKLGWSHIGNKNLEWWLV